jgi:hypothetical protein
VGRQLRLPLGWLLRRRDPALPRPLRAGAGFEQFIADPRPALRDLFGWLGVDPGVADRVELEARNTYKQPRNALTAGVLHRISLRRHAWRIVPQRLHRPLHDLLVTNGQKPSLDSATREKLRRLYAADRERLERQLGIELDW